MNELVDFKNAQVESLQKRVLLLETYLLEVTDKDCPSEYRRIIRKEILDES
jgi:hypothetical protein